MRVCLPDKSNLNSRGTPSGVTLLGAMEGSSRCTEDPVSNASSGFHFPAALGVTTNGNCQQQSDARRVRGQDERVCFKLKSSATLGLNGFVHQLPGLVSSFLELYDGGASPYFRGSLTPLRKIPYPGKVQQ